MLGTATKPPCPAMQFRQKHGRREGGGGGKLPRALRFWGPLEIFCWDLVIFLGEIFPRKGQDIWFEIGAPKKNLPRAPAKLSAALDKSIL